MSSPTIEDRLVILEQEVARLKERAVHPAGEGWVDRVTGSMGDYPEFARVLELGHELRRADHPDDGAE
jgi:hypothetical protein